MRGGGAPPLCSHAVAHCGAPAAVLSRCNSLRAPAPECTGAIALIGPMRMNYPKIVATLDYVSSEVETLLSDMMDV